MVAESTNTTTTLTGLEIPNCDKYVCKSFSTKPPPSSIIPIVCPDPLATGKLYNCAIVGGKLLWYRADIGVLTFRELLFRELLFRGNT